MKILIVSSRPPWPDTMADAMTVDRLVRFLVKRGHEVHLASFVENRKQQRELQRGLGDVCSGIDTVLLPKIIAYADTALTLGGRLPMQVQYYRSKKMRRTIDRLVETGGFDLIYTHLIRMAEYTRNAPIPKVMGVQVSQALNLGRMVAHSNDPVRKLFYRIEAAKVRSYEAEVCADFDRVFLCGSSDIEAIEKTAPVPNAVICPHGQDVPPPERIANAEREPGAIVITGVMSTYTNVDAATWFAKEVFPRIEAEVPEASFWIVGRSPQITLRALALSPRVHVTGEVSDVYDWLGRAQVAVAPMRIAAGMQNKVVQAMASGLPVVATSIANEGISATPDEHILLRDDPAEMANAIIELLRDARAREDLGAAARSFVEVSWTWEAHFLKLEEVLHEVVDECGARAEEPSRKNILIVTNHFWPEDFRINDLALGLREKGHRISVLTGTPNYPAGKFFDGYGVFKKQRENFQGIQVFRAPLIPRGSGSEMRLFINYVSYAVSACLLAPFACRGQYDVILVFETSPVTVGLPALVLKKLRGSPIMFWVQDIWPDSLSATGVIESETVLKWIGRLVRFIYDRCDRILIQSEAFSERVEQLAPAPERILYFPNSAEEFYRPVQLEPAAPERAQMPAGFRILFAGNIGVAQDFGTILDAAEILKGHPEIHWVILGDGRQRAWVEAELERRGLEDVVHLLGRHPAESMPRYFSLADALLVTLKKEPNFALTIPSKVQSYLACGRPVIAGLDGEGARIVREAEAGITCPAESPERLAKAALKIYELPETERRAMGNRGREYFERQFERNMLIDRLDEMMEELVEETSR